MRTTYFATRVGVPVGLELRGIEVLDRAAGLGDHLANGRVGGDLRGGQAGSARRDQNYGSKMHYGLA